MVSPCPIGVTRSLYERASAAANPAAHDKIANGCLTIAPVATPNAARKLLRGYRVRNSLCKVGCSDLLIGN
jgi:hypothetical protein